MSEERRVYDPTPAKRYRVSGIDEDGDVQAFESDSIERARDVEEQMLEDLDGVRFDDRG